MKTTELILPDEREGMPSASSMDRTVNCPGSPALIAICPKEENTEKVTTQGNRIHDALYEGEEMEQEDEETIRKKLQVQTELAAGLFAADYDLMGQVPAIIREVRMWVEKGMDKVASAKLDVAFIYKQHALIVDFKTGYADQTPSERNWQLKTQLVALKHTYPDVQVIRAAIATGRFRAKLDATDWRAHDIATAEYQILNAVHAAAQPDAPRHAGKWCRWCPASQTGNCPEAVTYALVANARLKLVTNDSLGVAMAVFKMDPAQLRYVWERSTIAIQIFKAVAGRLKFMSDDQLAALGMAKVPGSKRKTIKNDMEAKRLLGLSLDKESSDSVMVFDRTKAIELMKKDKKTTKKEATKLVDEILAPVMDENQNEASLTLL